MLRRRQSFCGRLFIDGTDGFDRRPEGRIGRIHQSLCQQRHDLGAGRQRIAQRQFDGIADPALAFRVQHIHRQSPVRGTGGGLQCQQPHLRTIAMGDDQLMALRGEFRQNPRRQADVMLLGAGGERLAPP